MLGLNGRLRLRLRVYEARRNRQVAAALDDHDVLERFHTESSLPDTFGRGFDERVVEYPWLFSRGIEGRVLDAGSALNHRFILDRLPGSVSLHVVTLAFEGIAYPERGISYVYGDLRDLPYRDATFDTVACISTLEHVGMDNSLYAPNAPRADDPRADRLRAARELRRVTRDEGRILVTVPYGHRQDHGWAYQHDLDDVRELAEALGGTTSTTIYEDTGGWQISSLGEALHAPRAVACIEAC